MAPAYEAKLKLGFEFTAIQLYVPSKMAVSEAESGRKRRGGRKLSSSLGGELTGPDQGC